MTHSMKTGIALLALLAAAGCSRSMPDFSDSGPAPLSPQPTPQVAANRLPPPPPPPPPPSATPAPTDTASTDTASNDTDQTETEVAALDPNAGSAASTPSTPPASTTPLSRNKVLGAYKVTTAGGNCQIILSLTKWSGGYRAASRGCPGAVADVTAWDVAGSNVVLRDSGGSQVASLSSTGDARYDGQTNGGQAISLYR